MSKNGDDSARPCHSPTRAFEPFVPTSHQPKRVASQLLSGSGSQVREGLFIQMGVLSVRLTATGASGVSAGPALVSAGCGATPAG